MTVAQATRLVTSGREIALVVASDDSDKSDFSLVVRREKGVFVYGIFQAKDGLHLRLGMLRTLFGTVMEAISFLADDMKGSSGSDSGDESSSGSLSSDDDSTSSSSEADKRTASRRKGRGKTVSVPASPQRRKSSQSGITVQELRSTLDTLLDGGASQELVLLAKIRAIDEEPFLRWLVGCARRKDVDERELVTAVANAINTGSV
jgi:hypothetical protein